MTVVVPMSREHLAALTQLEQQCFSQPRSFAQLEEELSNPSAIFLTALCDGEVAGYCGLHYVLDEGYVDDVAVFESFRRRGIGRLLMQALEDNARQKQLSFISLEVRASNQPAIALYAGMGYETVGRRKNFYSLPTEDALICTKQLHNGGTK